MPAGGGQDRSRTAATELTPGKVPWQTRNSPIHMRHSCNRNQDPSLLYPKERRNAHHTSRSICFFGNRRNSEALLKEDQVIEIICNLRGLILPKVCSVSYSYFRGRNMIKWSLVQKKGRLRIRSKQGLPSEVPSSWDGQGEHPAEPGGPFIPRQSRAAPQHVPPPPWQTSLAPILLCAWQLADRWLEVLSVLFPNKWTFLCLERGRTLVSLPHSLTSLSGLVWFYSRIFFTTTLLEHFKE